MPSPHPRSSNAKPSRGVRGAAKAASRWGWEMHASVGTVRACPSLAHAHAFRAGASGYLAGRAIWWPTFESTFPDWDAMREGIAREGIPYALALHRLLEQYGKPWTACRAFADGRFPTPDGKARLVAVEQRSLDEGLDYALDGRFELLDLPGIGLKVESGEFWGVNDVSVHRRHGYRVAELG